jgi:putative transposase
MTKTDSYPLPYIDDLLFRLGGANIFSKFDLYSGFWQMPLNPSDAEKTAFTTPLGLFEWITMPFGLKNAPASFQRMMDEVLHEAVTMGYSMVYMNDIVVFSKTEQEHVEHVEKVITLINNANLRMKIEKCDFGQKEIDLLGFTVSASGITPFAHKCKAITEVQVAHTVKGIQSFLDSSGTIRDLSHNCQKSLSHSLTCLKRGGILKKIGEFSMNKPLRTLNRHLCSLKC